MEIELLESHTFFCFDPKTIEEYYVEGQIIYLLFNSEKSELKYKKSFEFGEYVLDNNLIKEELLSNRTA